MVLDEIVSRDELQVPIRQVASHSGRWITEVSGGGAQGLPAGGTAEKAHEYERVGGSGVGGKGIKRGALSYRSATGLDTIFCFRKRSPGKNGG